MKLSNREPCWKSNTNIHIFTSTFTTCTMHTSHVQQVQSVFLLVQLVGCTGNSICMKYQHSVLLTSEIHHLGLLLEKASVSIRGSRFGWFFNRIIKIIRVSFVLIQQLNVTKTYNKQQRNALDVYRLMKKFLI